RYHLEAGDARSPDFLIDLLPAPTIDVERIEYEFPEYTAKPRSTLANQGDIQALEGTRVTIFAKANQPLRSATIEFDPSSRTAKTSEMRSNSEASREGRSTQRSTVNMRIDDRTASCSFDLKLDSERRKPFASTYQLRMETTQGHANDRPIVHTIQVVPDLPPEIEILQPQQDLIEVPEDGSTRIEIRAIDPDFGLRRIQLRAVSGAQEVLNTDLLDADPTVPGQNVVDYRFVPRKLMLQAGDEISYWAIAEDGRTAVGSATPEPNSERTRAYRIRITAAEKPSEAGEEKTNAADDQESTQPDKKPGRPNIPSAPEEKPKNPRNKPKNEQGNSSSNKGNDPNAKGNQQQGGAGNPDESAEGDAPDSKPDEKPDEQSTGGGAGKSSKKPSPKDGDKNSGNNQPSGDQPSGDQPSGAPSSGDQPSDEPSDNSQSKDDANTRGGAKGGTKGGEQGDRSESPADGDRPDPAEMADPSGQSGKSSNASGKSASGKASRNAPNANDPNSERGRENDSKSDDAQGDTASRTDTGNAMKRETGKNSENDRAANDTPKNSEQQQGGNQDSAQDASNSPPRTDSPHDGEVFERALERLRNQKSNQQQGAKPSQEPKSGAEGDSGKSDTRDTDNRSSNKQDGKQTNDQHPGDSKSGDSQAGDNQAGVRNSENDAGDPQGEPSSPEKSRKRGEQDAAGSQSDESGQDGTNGNKGKSSEGSPGSREGGQQKADRPGAEPDPRKPNKQQSRTDKRDQESGSGESGSGESGSGKSDGEKSGDPDSGERNTEKNRDNDRGSDSKSPGSEQDDPANAKQGSGKSSDPRNANPKDSNSGDKKPGDKKTSDKKPGEEHPGDNAPSSDANNDSSRDLKKNDRDDNQRPDPSRGKERGDRTGSQRDRGDESDRGSYAESGSTAGELAKIDREVPDGPEANQTYARKATDLALEYLKNQQENPDPKLLKELGWTPEELNAFVNRWEAMKRDAKENPVRRQELDSTLESLGLRPARDIKRRTTARSDGAGGNQDAGNRSAPPASYQDQINAFRKGVSRSRDRDGK
ncbi:MAG: hypothetical protein RIS70_2556, partial [Planctomycetota bacterium]